MCWSWRRRQKAACGLRHGRHSWSVPNVHVYTTYFYLDMHHQGLPHIYKSKLNHSRFDGFKIEMQWSLINVNRKNDVHGSSKYGNTLRWITLSTNDSALYASLHRKFSSHGCQSNENPCCVILVFLQDIPVSKNCCCSLQHSSKLTTVSCFRSNYYKRLI